MALSQNIFHLQTLLKCVSVGAVFLGDDGYVAKEACSKLEKGMLSCILGSQLILFINLLSSICNLGHEFFCNLNRKNIWFPLDIWLDLLDTFYGIIYPFFIKIFM